MVAERGEAVLHAGRIPHCGVPVSSGSRYQVATSDGVKEGEGMVATTQLVATAQLEGTPGREFKTGFATCQPPATTYRLLTPNLPVYQPPARHHIPPPARSLHPLH